MSDIQQLELALQKAVRRLRFERAWRFFWVGLVIGSAAWLVGYATFKLVPIPPAAVLGVGVLAACVPVVAAVVGWLKPVSMALAARWLDGRGRLEERVSTAWELSREGSHSDWARLVLRDAADRVKGVEPVRLFPVRLPEQWKWAFVCLLLASTLGFIPEYRSAEYLRKEKDKQVIRETGRQMAQLVRRTMAQRPPTFEETKGSMEAVAQLGDQLNQAKLSRSDALKDLASATDKLRQEARELSKSPGLRKMEMAARNANGQAAGQNSDLQKQLDSLNKALGDKAGKAKPDAIDQMRKDLQKIKEAAKGMANKDAGIGDSARQQLSQSMAELSRQAEAMGMPLPSLEEAIAALAANQVDQFLKDLNTAEQDLEKIQQMAQALQQMQQQAEKIGKNLAEQLKNGQAQAAVRTLQKLQEQLQKGELTKQDLDKLTAEIAEAVKPAGEYGKAAEFLKKAKENAAKGEKADKAEASKDLADAAKELEKLMEQMADAQSLNATLEALKRAQMAVGNGMSWAEGGMPGMGGPKGRPGRGVGTWGDDSQWMDVTDVQDGWDNSGVDRPDTDARGTTDRGEGEIPDTLVPTRVKGQMSQGGPMPSITLRGVSIKGQSTVAYEEKVMSAQGEAQSAISQDQVPRAYKGAVKDYFDDLK